ncbi:energy-coupling factor transporter transmembrane component T [Alkalibaculum sporogenes]|nr:energy-coupling factor transporter transmembrane component T [Alkalibaculum sporogenes]
MKVDTRCVPSVAKSTDALLVGDRRTLEPRTKLLILLIINITSFVQSNVLCETICIAMIIFAMLYHRSYRLAIKNLLLFIAMALLILLTLRVENTVVGMLSVVLIMARKIFPTFMFAALLMSTTQVGEMTASLQTMHTPRQITIPIVVIMRFFPTIKEESRGVLDAAKVRGIRFTFWNFLSAPGKMMEYIMVPLMMQLSVVAEELSAAAVTRGIDSDKQRTSLYQTRFGIVDIIFILLFSANLIFAFMGGGIW